MENKEFLAVNKMMNIHRRHTNIIHSMVSDWGIHVTQHRILMHLSFKGNLQSQKELAERLEITPAAITQALQKLECDGYIERKLGNDNRFNEITITNAGREIVEKTKTLFSTIDKTMFDNFSDEELDTMIGFLDRILSNFKKLQGDFK